VPKNIPLGALARATTKAEGAVPTTAELFAAGKAGRTAAKESGFVAPEADVARLRDEFAAVSKEEGHAKLAPKTSGIMEDGLPASGPMTAPELITLRRQLTNAGKNGGSEAQAAKDAKGIVDKYLGENIPEANTANANFAAGYRSKAIDKAIDDASRANNPDAALVSQFRAIRNDPKKSRGYSADELEKMDNIIGGGVPGALKRLGGLIGGAGDIRTLITAGPTVGIAPVFGYALRKIGNAVTNNEVQKLSEMVRSSAPASKAVSASLKDWSIAAHAFEVEPSVRAMAKVTIASRNLSNNLNVAGISVPPNYLLRAIKGPVKAANDQKSPNVQDVGQEE